jgi:hypothetical protein
MGNEFNAGREKQSAIRRIRHLYAQLASKDPTEQALRVLGVRYRRGADGLYTVFGDIDLSGQGLSELPDLSRVSTVHGNFYCQDNNLRNLKGCPRNILGDFICSNNKMEMLEGGPLLVAGVYDCSRNRLRTLIGAPERAYSDFICSFNSLETLTGAPRVVEGSFDCSANLLKTLLGGPERVLKNFDCSLNYLKTLEGAPSGMKSFRCVSNMLVSLKGVSWKIRGAFNCSVNSLRSMKDGPIEVDGVVTCDHNNLESLDHVPRLFSHIVSDFGTFASMADLTKNMAKRKAAPKPR